MGEINQFNVLQRRFRFLPLAVTAVCGLFAFGLPGAAQAQTCSNLRAASNHDFDPAKDCATGICVLRVCPDTTYRVMTICGHGFGSTPRVALGGEILITQQVLAASSGSPCGGTDESIIASLDEGVEGTHKLVVANGTASSEPFFVKIGDLAGPQGPAGSAGPPGPQGIAGAVGPAGLKGATGPAGTAGLKGATGSAGIAGLTGAVGPAGIAGLTGATGPAGIAGLTGATGPAGSAGLTGATGPAGPAGQTGAVGPAGTPGVSGTNGMNGAQGVAGPAGATGAQGPAGTGGGGGAAFSATGSSITLPPGRYALHTRTEVATSTPPSSITLADGTLVPIPTLYSAQCNLLDTSSIPATQIDLVHFTVPSATVTGAGFNTTTLSSTVLATLDAIVNPAVQTTYNVSCGAAAGVFDSGPLFLQGAGKLVAIQVSGP